MELVDLQSGEAFEPFTSSPVILDTMSQHILIVREPLLNHLRKVSAVLAPVIGENSWKRDLSPDSSLEDVQKKALATLLRMETKGAALNLGG